MKDEPKDKPKDKNAGFKPTPIRLPVELDTAITEAADQLRMSKQDVIRLTIDIGLKHLKANTPSELPDGRAKHG